VEAMFAVLDELENKYPFLKRPAKTAPQILEEYLESRREFSESYERDRIWVRRGEEIEKGDELDAT